MPSTSSRRRRICLNCYQVRMTALHRWSPRDPHRWSILLMGVGVSLTGSRKLLLRIYGPQVEHLIDRENELQILRRLARKKIGPRLLGTFTNGRFEEFFNARTLTAMDLRIPETSKQIAKRMRELHDGIELLEEERDAGPFMWRNWDSWVGRCEDVITWLDEKMAAGNQGPAKSGADAWKQRGLVCGVEWSVFRKTVERYRKWLEEQYGGYEAVKDKLVFAHNDVSWPCRAHLSALIFADPIWQSLTPSTQRRVPVATSSKRAQATDCHRFRVRICQRTRAGVRQPLCKHISCTFASHEKRLTPLPDRMVLQLPQRPETVRPE